MTGQNIQIGTYTFYVQGMMNDGLTRLGLGDAREGKLVPL